MKEVVVGSSINLIKKNHPEYDKEKIEVIEYGLASLYLTISKTIIIGAIALLLGILKEFVVFTIIYNIIRIPSFGLHATKSWICLVSSGIIFMGIPYICTIVSIPVFMKIILGFIGIIFIYKNSPADTEKRPIVNPIRRQIYKNISVILAILYIILAIFIPNNFLSNSFIAALLIQCLIISPMVYKLFKIPHDNYKNYLK